MDIINENVEDQLDVVLLENVLLDHKNFVNEYNLGTYIDVDGEEFEDIPRPIQKVNKQKSENFLLENTQAIETSEYFDNLLKKNESVFKLAENIEDILIKRLIYLNKRNEDLDQLKTKEKVRNIEKNSNKKEEINKEAIWSSINQQIFNSQFNIRKHAKGIWTPEEQLKLGFAIKNDVISRQIARKDKDLDENVKFFEIKLKELKSKYKLSNNEKELKIKYMRALNILKKDYLKKNVSELIGKGDNQIDWLKIAVQDFDDYRTADECETIWDRLLHPKYNISEWEKEEERRLIFLVNKYNKQNWDKIAEELNTNRSAHSCFTHYQVNLGKNFSPWSEEEDKLLKNILPLYKYGNFVQWSAVSSFFPNRTRHQVYVHWKNKKKKTIKWTLAEDITIFAASRFVGSYECNLTPFLSHRSSKSIGQRWRKILVSQAKKTNHFTKEDDQDLWNIGKKYDFNIDKIMDHFFDYERYSICVRLKLLKKFANLKDGNIKFEEIPRQFQKNISTFNLLLFYGRFIIRNGTESGMIYKKVSNFISKQNSKNLNYKNLKPISDMMSNKIDINKKLTQLLRVQYFPYCGRQKQLFLDLEISKNTELTQCWIKMLKGNFNYTHFYNNSYFKQERFERDIFTKLLIQPLNTYPNPQIKFIPPNFPTIVGFRTLLLNRVNLRNNNIKNNTTSDIISIKAKQAKALLLYRMRMLFLGPAFLTAFCPNECDLMNTKEIDNNKILKTYSKKQNNIPNEQQAPPVVNIQGEISNVNIQKNHLSVNKLIETSDSNLKATKIMYISPDDIQNKISQLIKEKIDASKILIINQADSQLKNIQYKNIKTYSRKNTNKISAKEITSILESNKSIENRNEDISKRNENQSESVCENIEFINIDSINSQSNSKNYSEENNCLIFEDPLNINSYNNLEIKKVNKNGHNKKRKAPIHLIEKQKLIKKQRLEGLGIEEIPKPKRTYIKSGFFKKPKVETTERRTSNRIIKKGES